MDVQSDEWWVDVTHPMLEEVRKKIRLLVHLIERAKKDVVYSDFEDLIGAGTEVELPGTGGAVGSPEFAQFRKKARHYHGLTLQFAGRVKPDSYCVKAQWPVHLSGFDRDRPRHAGGVVTWLVASDEHGARFREMPGELPGLPGSKDNCVWIVVTHRLSVFHHLRHFRLMPVLCLLVAQREIVSDCACVGDSEGDRLTSRHGYLGGVEDQTVVGVDLNDSVSFGCIGRFPEIENLLLLAFLMLFHQRVG